MVLVPLIKPVIKERKSEVKKIGENGNYYFQSNTLIIAQIILKNKVTLMYNYTYNDFDPSPKNRRLASY